jgi:hypothetical protein
MHKPALTKSPLLTSTAHVDVGRVATSSTVLTSAGQQNTASDDQRKTSARDLPRCLMSAPQLAERLNVSLSWVNKSHIYGTGPPATRVGRRRLYDPVDVERWLATRKQRSTSERDLRPGS